MSDSGIETEYIVDMLLDLKSRDQKLLLMRMGIVTGKPIIMEEVAEILGITKARVKQIENKFLRKVAAFIKRRNKWDVLRVRNKRGRGKKSVFKGSAKRPKIQRPYLQNRKQELPDD